MICVGKIQSRVVQEILTNRQNFQIGETPRRARLPMLNSIGAESCSDNDLLSVYGPMLGPTEFLLTLPFGVKPPRSEERGIPIMHGETLHSL